MPPEVTDCGKLPRVPLAGDTSPSFSLEPCFPRVFMLKLGPPAPATTSEDI